MYVKIFIYVLFMTRSDVLFYGQPQRTIIFHDTVVGACNSAVVFIDINTGKTINSINLYDEISDFSEVGLLLFLESISLFYYFQLSNGELAVWTKLGVRIISFQDLLLKKRVKIQGIYQLENKCHIQVTTKCTTVSR